MPFYKFKCNSCKKNFEVLKKINEEKKTSCPYCDSEDTERVYGSVGVVFKGSGFYSTDSKKTSSKKAEVSK